jgi:putative hydrolase of the HAD superfamily
MKGAGAVLWDVYGTLLALSVGDLDSSLAKKDTMLDAFGLTAREFGFGGFLDGDPAKNLLELYVDEIRKSHRRKRSHGVRSPEVKIENIWLRILKRLAARGYEPRNDNGLGLDLALRVAYFFDDVYQTKKLYPGARRTLEGIRKLGLKQGIVSNAQFYTPIALNMLLQTKKSGGNRPLETLFDRRLIFFSYKLGVSKPNPLAFDRARSRLESMGIRPEQVLCVGNDVRKDMMPARAAGFRSVLFAGDRESLNLREEQPECAGFKPDAIITSLPQLLEIVG